MTDPITKLKEMPRYGVGNRDSFADYADELIAVIEAANAVIFDCSDDLVLQEKRLKQALSALKAKLEGV